MKGQVLVAERFCGNCGHDVAADASACAWCGAALSDTTPGDGSVDVPAPGPVYSERSEGVMIGVVAVLVIALVLIASLLIVDDSGPGSSEVDAGDRQRARSTGERPALDETSSTSSPSTATSSTTTVSTTSPSTTTMSTVPGSGDVRAEPPGLFCRDLAARGYAYSAAVEYWQVHGHSERMDADGNGRPCETVYPAAVVDGFWRP